MVDRAEDFDCKKGYLINKYFLDTKVSIDDFVRETKGKPYYIPAKAELLKYEDSSYYEMTAELITLENYIQEVMHAGPTLAKSFIDDIQIFSATGVSANELFMALEREGLPVEDEQFRKLVPLIADAYNSIRIWENRGHSAKELYKSTTK